jgi:hypothetical protein
MTRAITITMSQATVQALAYNGMQLQVFKGIYASPGAQMALWHAMTQFTPTISIAWPGLYGAFVITSTMESVCTAKLGDIVIVDGPLTAQPGGKDRHGITIVNRLQQSVAAGPAEYIGSFTAPTCLLSLDPGATADFRPRELVLLTLSANVLSVNTVVSNTGAPSVLADLSHKSTAQLAYDIDKGWDISGNTNVSYHAQPVELAKVLNPQPLDVHI